MNNNESNIDKNITNEEQLTKIRIEGLDLEVDFEFEADELSDIQRAYEKIASQENEPLKDGIPYPSVLKKIEVGYTYKKRIPTVNFIYEVDDGTTRPKTANDTYFLSYECLDISLKRLKKTLTQFNFELSMHDVKNANSIVAACDCLIGEKAIIKQSTRDGQYSNYEIIKID